MHPALIDTGKAMAPTIGLQLIMNAKPVPRREHDKYQLFRVMASEEVMYPVPGASRFIEIVGLAAIFGVESDVPRPGSSEEVRMYTFGGYSRKHRGLPPVNHGMQLIYPEDRPPAVHLGVGEGYPRESAIQAEYWLLVP